MKIKAAQYLRQLEQKIQHDASQIDNYLEQRVVILTNLAKLVEKAIDLDKTTFTQIALNRSGRLTDQTRNELSGQVDTLNRNINLTFENYPDLKANQNFSELSEELRNTENKISFSRQFYNDTVQMYNTAIMKFPTNLIAGMLGFKEEAFFQIDETEKNPVQVKF